MPEARDQVEQTLRLADADRHDGRARGLERHVVGDAAGVERVVQAVGDRRRWRARRRCAKAAPPIAEFASWSARVRPMAPGRRSSRGDVQAHERLARRAQVLAEGRLRGLRGRAGRPWSAAGASSSERAPAEALAVEGRAALQVGELALAAPRHRPRAHASRPATRRAARWAARCRDASEESAASAGGECGACAVPYVV